jgi:polysaccharide biosynthesis protein PelF
MALTLNPSKEFDLPAEPPFSSFFLGGFECSTHRLACGRRLDMIAATAHDRHAAADYARLREHGIRTAREGIRWHLIEATPGRFDFRSVRPMLHAADEAGIQILWDVLHYGWPDDVDIFGPQFLGRFARLARRFARFLADEGHDAPWVVPINEISFLSWTGGEVGQLNPFARSRGFELKVQLVRASLAAIREIRDVVPAARFAQVEPIFHVIADPARPHEAPAAEAYRLAQYQAWDMLSGRLLPELGGRPEDLDVLGVNYYPWNQWTYQGPTAAGTTIGPEHEGYRPFRDMLRENFDRYGRPLFVAETGTEGDDPISLRARALGNRA